ncbi:MAG TPA: hypothetical protein VHH88_02435 [Verrucomicrobiae bacterium]|nr:hypothetical protein [Verrucomicrobiae bacterium]
MERTSSGFAGNPAVARVRSSRLRLLVLIFSFLFAMAALAEQGLLSYSLSVAPSMAKTLWSPLKLSNSAGLRDVSPTSADVPAWVRLGARNLELSLSESSRGDRHFPLGIPALQKFHPGVGDYFSNDTAGKPVLTGTRDEDLRWYYLRIRMFGRSTRENPTIPACRFRPLKSFSSKPCPAAPRLGPQPDNRG